MSSPYDTITAKNKTSFRLKVIVVTLVILVALDFMASLYLYNDYQKNQELTNTMAKDIDGLYYENIQLSKALDKYNVDVDYLQSIGATEDQAVKIIKASKVHNVDPK